MTLPKPPQPDFDKIFGVKTPVGKPRKPTT